MKKITEKEESRYWMPTPKKWRQLGDALLAMSTYAEVQQAIQGHTQLLTVVVLVGLLGKFLTNFFKEDEA